MIVATGHKRGASRIVCPNATILLDGASETPRAAHPSPFAPRRHNELAVPQMMVSRPFHELEWPDELRPQSSTLRHFFAVSPAPHRPDFHSGSSTIYLMYRTSQCGR
jgi:hypothetical protein